MSPGDTAATVGSQPPRLRVALLLSTDYFEDFYGRGLGLSRDRYLEAYRNDWSWDWCEMLAEAGVDASIYLTTIEEGVRAATTDGYNVRFLPLGGLAVPWVRYPALARSPVGRYLGQAVNAGSFLRPLRSALDEDEIDVLCIQEYWTARFDVLVRSLERPVVVVDQGLPDRHEMKLLKRGSFARCAAAVVQTEREAAKVTRYGGHARRIPNAVDTALFSPPDDAPTAGGPHAPTILCVGRLHDVQKRISDVIRALAMLPPQWRLEIAGSGPDRTMLEELGDHLSLSERIRYLGFVSDSTQLRDLYRRATVLALPSAYEGLPMVLLEAMSCGTPVVGSDIAAIAEVIEHGHTGLVTPVGSPELLARAICEAAVRRLELGEAARASILRDYDHRVVGPRLAALLQSVRTTMPAAV
jgi:glycosyltransferase involved in cell wall biosynthesis